MWSSFASIAATMSGVTAGFGVGVSTVNGAGSFFGGLAKSVAIGVAVTAVSRSMQIGRAHV